MIRVVTDITVATKDTSFLKVPPIIPNIIFESQDDLSDKYTKISKVARFNPGHGESGNKREGCNRSASNRSEALRLETATGRAIAHSLVPLCSTHKIRKALQKTKDQTSTRPSSCSLANPSS